MTPQDWIGKFFENRGWLGIVQHDSTNGLNVAGTPVSVTSAMAATSTRQIFA